MERHIFSLQVNSHETGPVNPQLLTADQLPLHLQHLSELGDPAGDRASDRKLQAASCINTYGG
jgi:hypothetical protein